MGERWNCRFLAYCNGEEPEAVLARDANLYPGGKMAGFLLWSNGRLAEYRRINPAAFLHGVLSDHAAYDAWLNAR